MKKFLTVLLALSVVFTYTVGTAFATAVDATDAIKVKAHNYAATIAEQAGNNSAIKHKEDYSAKTIADANKAAARFIENTLVDALIETMEAAVDMSGDEGYKAFETELKAWGQIAGDSFTYLQEDVETFIPSGSGIEPTTYVYDDLFVYYAKDADFANRVTEAKATLNVDLSIYSTKDDKVNTGYTYKSYAEKLIADAKTAVGKVEADDNLLLEAGKEVKAADGTTSLTYKEKLNALLYGFTYDVTNTDTTAVYKMNTAYNKDSKLKDLPAASEEIPTTDTSGAKVAGVFGLLKNQLLVVDEPLEDEAGKLAIEKAQTAMAAYAKGENYYGDLKFELGDTVTADDLKTYGVTVVDKNNITRTEAAALNTAIMADINATLEIVNVYFAETSTDPVADESAIEGSTFDHDGDGSGGGSTAKIGFAGLVTFAKTAIDKYDEKVTLAAKMKKALMFDGTKKYDDAAIDVALAKDKTELYANFLDLAKAKDNLGSLTPAKSEALAAANAAEAKFADAYTTTTPEADKKYCKNYYDDTATNKGDYDVIKAETVAKLSVVKTVAEVNAIMAEADAKLAKIRAAADNTQAFKDEVKKYQDAFASYNAAQALLLNAKSEYRPESFTKALDKGKEIIADAMNTAAVVTAYEEAKELYKTFKTDAQLDLMAAEVEKAIAALPSTVATDLSTEAQFLTALKSYNEFNAELGTDKTEIKGYSTFEIKCKELKTLQQNAVVAAINALPAVISSTDKAAVEKVRATLEKYLELYEVPSATFAKDNTTFAVSNYDTLVAKEEDVADAEVIDVTQLIAKLTNKSAFKEVQAAKTAYDALNGAQQRSVGEAYLYKVNTLYNAGLVEGVEKTTIKISSKAYKGYNKITWKRSLGFKVDGYEVYRSAKNTKNFKKIATYKKQTYCKNTKNLKKGTRYYYKVKGFRTIDGVKVYTKSSIVVNKVAK